ncbi:serine hydrolase domain-containing protein [Actinomarinicola tropica]|uniref:Serine hydrolase n=1 Tax=Actinomarinicola tropica TaxID=2789776 RepID=A0A5Q2RF74_9ACTN|nr:serine hydrolase domain-containing protein [Actinomarinicola tropica]QGG94333.1 serine hydrolase [Actinomarinicola tropica]
MTGLTGNTDPRFQGLADIVERQLESGYDLGASLAVAVDGEVVTDCWGGWADEARTRPWEADTITNVWSTTKTMTALSALMCIDRGLVDPHEKVATYWPEFGVNGKADIEVRHLMSHTSGVSSWAAPFGVEDLFDDERATAHLAAQEPWWEPGTASGYHALNYGHLIGEVIRRVDGRGLKEFFAEEVAGPLGADFTIGCPTSEHGRIAPVIPPPPVELPASDAVTDLDSVAMKTFMTPGAGAETANTDGWRAATIGGANGHGNARSVATIQAAVSNGGVASGVKLLSPATIERIFEPQSDGPDLAIGLPVRFGIGYALANPADMLGIASGRCCFWGGWGGSIVLNDLDNRITLAYVMNRMQAGILGNETSAALLAEYRSIVA